MTTSEELSKADLAELSKLKKAYEERTLELTPEQEEFVKTKLSSKFWRLNNLYKIRDKDSKLITLRCNNAQFRALKKFNHIRKIFLKIRQTGISTLYLAYNLDSCLFSDGHQAGIQSYTQAEADKLSLRAELMWNELDENIKELMGLKVVYNNSKGIMFSNGSILKIGNFRGDTLQSLHVSELAKISKIAPEKAKELKTGAFQSVGKNNKITIESTAEGKAGLFYEMWTKAEAKVIQLGGKLSKFGGQDPDCTVDFSPFDFQPIFISWVIDEDCKLDHPTPYDEELSAYFRKIEQELDLKLTDQQKWWYASKAEELGEDMKQEYPTTATEAFEQSVEGTYYKNEFKKLKVKPDLYDLNLKVHSAFDLGYNDTFSIGFFQVHPDNSVKIIGEYQNSGHALEHYWDIFCYLNEELGWVHGTTYVPHDTNQHELIAGKTRWTAMVDLGFNPDLVAKHSLQDGIEATRQFLKTVEIDSKCETIIDAIQNYRKKYDRSLGVFLKSPVHDEYSHTADMVRYIAMGLKYSPISREEIYVRSKTTQKRQNFSGYDI
jgi:hypothetical protein